MIGWLLVALPLLIAIGYASVNLNRLATRSEGAVLHASLSAQLGWELKEDLVQMERSLRQYEVLHDPSLIAAYTTARNEWRGHMRDFAEVPLQVPLLDQTKAMLALEADAHAQFGMNAPDLALVHDIHDQLKRKTFALLEEASRYNEAERQAFRAETETMYQRLLIALVVSLLLAGIFFWFGQRLLARLLDSVGRAVIALGNNLLERRIRIKGPDDLRWLGKRLDWLRRRMLALEEERTRSLRHISHELKTPLAALREGASLLAEGLAGPLSEKQHKIAGIMQGNALRLQALIDGLLKLQQAEHARDRIEPIAIRLDDVIQHVLATHKLAARDKRLRIKGTLAPLSVMGGQEEVTTIVSNLLSNAIKFSPEHGTVRILLARSNERAVLDVMDEGPGVPEADRTRIFEPFYRARGTQSIAGVGLGLAIAHEFAVAQRGALDLVESPSGAHFRVTLPLAGGRQ